MRCCQPRLATCPAMGFMEGGSQKKLWIEEIGKAVVGACWWWARTGRCGAAACMFAQPRYSLPQKRCQPAGNVEFLKSRKSMERRMEGGRREKGRVVGVRAEAWETGMAEVVRQPSCPPTRTNQPPPPIHPTSNRSWNSRERHE